jgi:predicted nucleotidyltransferase
MLPIKTKVRPTGFPPVSKTLPQAIKRLAAALKPEKIILFGSYAYGNPSPDSDVDLLIVKDGDKKQNYITASMLLYPRQFPVDIIVRTPAEIERALKNEENFFTRDIVFRGKVLYERKKRTRSMARPRRG